MSVEMSRFSPIFEIPPGPKLTWWKRLRLKAQRWWIWNVIMRRRITFPAIEDSDFGFSADEIVTTNQLSRPIGTYYNDKD